MYNLKNVLRYMFGKGSISNLKSILDAKTEGNNYIICFIDKWFEDNKSLEKFTYIKRRSSFLFK